MEERAKLEELAARLEQNEDYRVLRRLKPLDRYEADPGDDTEKKIGVFLDTETTGLEHQSERVIELALVPFEFSSDGRIYRVFEAFDQLQDPGREIPRKVVELTGITDSMVAGKKIDRPQVASVVDNTAVIIAHNARFDRPFVESEFPVFEDKAWACTDSQIPWNEEGIGSRKLEYIASRYGFFFDGHRAATDCLAAIHILAQKLPVSGQPALKVLLDRARQTTCRVWAVDSPFDLKDRLKSRNYRWNNGEYGRYKAWYRDVDESECDAELEFLRKEIYARDMNPPVDRINAFKRFSKRI